MVEKSSFSEQRVINIVNDINLYLKFLEQRVIKMELELKNLFEKLERLEKKMEEEKNILKKEIDSLRINFSDIALELEKTKTEVKKKADAAELREIRELLDLFNPLKSTFVTKEEVKRMFNELINTNKQ